MTVRIDHAVSPGRFTVDDDGGTHVVENNIWVVGNDRECIVIDTPSDIASILSLLDDRRVAAILTTHAHDDHIRAAPDLSLLTGAPIFLHPADLPLWRHTHDLVEPDSILTDNLQLTVAGTTVHVLHTPGHTPGSCCFHLPRERAVFSGDTLVHGGPGATGHSFNDFRAIVRSVEQRLLTLPASTTVHTGHGPDTTTGAESQHVTACRISSPDWSANTLIKIRSTYDRRERHY